MTCPQCGKENKNSNIKCEFCQAKLIDISKKDIKEVYIGNTNLEVNEYMEKSSNVLYVIVMIIIGFWFSSVSLVFIISIFIDVSCNIQDLSGKENYIKAIATVENINCSDAEIQKNCRATYKYEVNDIYYTLISDITTSKNKLNEVIVVYYNPNNPSDAVIYTSLFSKSKNDIIVLVIILVIYIIIGIKLKKVFKHIGNGKQND